MSIHNDILTRIQDSLIDALITTIPADDPSRVGIVMLGNLQGDPDPDEARISISLYENDPDRFVSGAVTGMTSDWSDEVEFVEIGAATTWKRCFTIKGRCLLERTQEELDDSRMIASTVRTRIEHTLPTIDFSDIGNAEEYVARRIISRNLRSEMLQAGGPQSYDYHFKIRFDLLTTAKES